MGTDKNIKLHIVTDIKEKATFTKHFLRNLIRGDMTAEINKETVKLYIGGIDPAWTSDELKTLLLKHTSVDIIRVDIVREYAFAFVANKEASDKIIEKVNGTEIEGHNLVIQISKNKQNLPDSDDLCFECGNSGHWAKRCPRRRARYNKAAENTRFFHGARGREVYRGGYGGGSFEMSTYEDCYARGPPYFRNPYGFPPPPPTFGYDYGAYPVADPYSQGQATWFAAPAPPRYVFNRGGYF